MEFKSDIALGELVYLLTDPDQLPRMVTGIKFTIDGGALFTLCQGTVDTDHYRKEIAKSKNIEMALGIRNN
jgi:hypothetical protein